MTLEPGDTLGAYEIVAPLASDGMGEVYKARDRTLGREVALKILPGGLAHDVDRALRFTREAQALAALNHPNVGVIYGLDQAEVAGAGRVQFLLLELIDGATLADRLFPARSGEPRPLARFGADHRVADRQCARGGARQRDHPSGSQA